VCQGDASLKVAAACEATVAVQAALLQRCLPTSAQTLAAGFVPGASAPALTESFACFTDAATHLAQLGALAGSAARAGSRLHTAESLLSERVAALADPADSVCAESLLPDATERVIAALQDLESTAANSAEALAKLQ
jgi:hypothetical protein